MRMDVAVVNSLVEVKTEEGTDVSPRAGGQLHRNTADRIRIDVIESRTDETLLQTQCRLYQSYTDLHPVSVSAKREL